GHRIAPDPLRGVVGGPPWSRGEERDVDARGGPPRTDAVAGLREGDEAQPFEGEEVFADPAHIPVEAAGEVEERRVPPLRELFEDPKPFLRHHGRDLRRIYQEEDCFVGVPFRVFHHAFDEREGLVDSTANFLVVGHHSSSIRGSIRVRYLLQWARSRQRGATAREPDGGPGRWPELRSRTASRRNESASRAASSRSGRESRANHRS